MSADAPREQAPRLVSVICRSMARPQLEQALASVAAQTWPALELVLVDAAGRDAPAPDCGAVPVRRAGGGRPLSRPEAANAGLDAARGRYLMFLDDDDWIAPDHVANLAARLEEGRPGVRAAYSSARKADADGGLLEYVFRSEYEPTLLMQGNFIPIHAVLFERGLLERGCRFDTDFEIYEDWDFWLQLSRHTRFEHVDAVTAFYRQGAAGSPASDGALDPYDNDGALGRARGRLYDKWLPRWSGAELNRLISLMDQSEEIEQLDARLRDISSTLASEREAHHELVGRLDARLRRAAATLAGEREAHLKLVGELKARLARQEAGLRDQGDHIARLEDTLDGIYRSFSWKAMGPARRLARRLSPPEDGAAEATDADRLKARHARLAKRRLAAFLAEERVLEFARRDRPAVSVVVVLFNQAHLSLACLESLLERADVPFELIVVDNGSRDATRRLLGRLRNARILRNRRNLGFVRAVNQAAAAAAGEYLLLLNNDATLEPGCMSSALAALRSADDIGAVGGRILMLDGRLQEAGCIVWRDGACLGYGRGERPDAPEYMFRRDVDYCSGAFLMLRRERFLRLGGFDEAFAPAYYEDSDFCLRLGARGLRTVYEPRAAVTHFEFASSGGMRKAVRLQARHRGLLLERHRGALDRRPENSPANVLRARTANAFDNALVIDDRVPTPSLGAGYPRSALMLNLMSAMELNVTFYPLVFPECPWDDARAALAPNIEVMLDRGRDGLRGFLDARRGHYRHVVVSRAENMAFVGGLIAAEPSLLEGAALIYDAEAIAARREAMRRRLQGEEVGERREREMIAAELRLARAADITVAVSEEEAGLFRRAGAGDTRVLGHAVAAAPTPKAFEERRGMLFVGALRDEDSPNVDSLQWFAAHVLPLVRSEIPDMVLHVVGDRAAPSLSLLDQDGIRFAGRVEDIGEYDDCRVFVAPTRFAAGIPHKLHEAAARGLPAVATPLLAGQLGWRDGVELLTAEDADAFAAQCVRLHRDGALWRALRGRALEAVAADCSERAFREALEALFRSGGSADSGQSRQASRQRKRCTKPTGTRMQADSRTLR